jgi:hypothetical protein
MSDQMVATFKGVAMIRQKMYFKWDATATPPGLVEAPDVGGVTRGGTAHASRFVCAWPAVDSMTAIPAMAVQCILMVASLEILILIVARMSRQSRRGGSGSTRRNPLHPYRKRGMQGPHRMAPAQVLLVHRPPPLSPHWCAP